MKNSFVFLLFSFIVPFYSFSQYPPLELTIGTITSGSTGSVNVPVMAGTNFQNVTQISGTFTFNPSVLTWNSMQNWGLSNPGGAVFSNTTSGTISFNWGSLISVGPSATAGTVLFNLQFNIIGAAGTSSPIGFIGVPQPLNWQNGFGWGGNNFAITNGLVNIGCAGTNPTFNAISNFYTYDFVDASAGATSWAWTLGDGTTATTQNVNHTYASPGAYQVCLTATNACGTATSCQTINVCPAIPVAGFSFFQNGTTVIFTDATQGSAVTRVWDFGDGTTGSSSGSFIHNFPGPGSYVVCLTASNGCGTSNYCQTLVIVCPFPTSSFTQTNSNFAYSFTSTSNGALSWAWNFGDGTSSTLQNPTHTFTNNGSFNVCLVASNNCGFNSSCQLITVNCPTPGSNWTSQTMDLVANFANTTPTTPLSLIWSFGDGATSALQNPTHTYTNSGLYNVCLKSTNACGADSLCVPLAIAVTGLEDFNQTLFEIYPNPTNDFVQFTSPTNEEFKVDFYSIQGQLISSNTYEKGEKINLKNWSKGSYFVVISNSIGTSKQRLLIN